MEKKPINQAIDQLKSHLSDIATVQELAELMGYADPKKFADCFLKYYGVRPQKAVIYIRLKSITTQLRADRKRSVLKIAQAHSMPDEKSLNKYTNYHLGISPTALKTIPKQKIITKLEKLGSNPG